MTTELQAMGDGGSVGMARSNDELVAGEVSESGLKITQFKLEFFKPSKAFSLSARCQVLCFIASLHRLPLAVCTVDTRNLFYFYWSPLNYIYGELHEDFLRAFLVFVATPSVPVDRDVLTGASFAASSTNEQNDRTFCGMPIDEGRREKSLCFDITFRCSHRFHM